MTTSLHSPELTLPLARQALLVSFWLSQGDSGFQRLLFGWLHVARPAWRVTDNLVEPLVAQVTHAALALVARGGHVEMSDEAIAHEVRLQAIHLQQELASSFVAGEEEEQEARRETLAAFVRLFLARDHHSLCQSEAGRQRLLPPSGRERLHQDRWFSFSCSYLLASHKVGCLAYDELLEELRRVCQGADPESTSILQLALEDEPVLPAHLEEVVSVSLQHHPPAALDPTPFLTLLDACRKHD